MAILCYHAVEPGWDSSVSVRPEAFEQHCAWLSRERRVLPLNSAVLRLRRSGSLPWGETALSFDDGFASVHEQAFPILMRYRVPATVFVVAATLAPGGKVVDWVDEPVPAPLRTLTLDQVLEMQSAGIEFGSHSYRHHDLTTLSSAECEQDLRRSRELLEDLLQQHVRFLAYPRGRHNETVRRAAERAGYTHAFTLPEGPEPLGPMAVPRVGMWGGNGVGMLRLKATTLYLRLRMSPLSTMQLGLRARLAAGQA
jgi:peptidoglycan/xylan/chitin deacetylase (PgdA/CDA1 family)